jgi:hypothetical protein
MSLCGARPNQEQKCLTVQEGEMADFTPSFVYALRKRIVFILTPINSLVHWHMTSPVYYKVHGTEKGSERL